MAKSVASLLVIFSLLSGDKIERFLSKYEYNCVGLHFFKC